MCWGWVERGTGDTGARGHHTMTAAQGDSHKIGKILRDETGHVGEGESRE